MILDDEMKTAIGTALFIVVIIIGALWKGGENK